MSPGNVAREGIPFELFRSMYPGDMSPGKPIPDDKSPGIPRNWRSGKCNAKTKKRWSFGKSMKDPSQRVTVENDSTRMMSCMPASEKEQNKHAIPVAATAAAVAGLPAAVAVVRLTSDGTSTLFSGREKWTAIKIQSVYSLIIV
nr:hypothetical protein [Tanacetum cinerariifolium]